MVAAVKFPRSGVAGRSRARRLALQAIYQWQLSGTDPEEILRQFHESPDSGHPDQAYFEALVRGVTAEVARLDAILQPALDRPAEQVDPVERALLRLATWELGHRPDVPYAVVLDEAVALARKFGAEQGHRFVNGVLDQVARRLRPVEHPRGDPDRAEGLLAGWGTGADDSRD